MKLIQLIVLTYLALISCTPSVSKTKEKLSPKEEKVIADFSYLKRKLADLPTSGRTDRRPWDGYYWPKIKGGIYARLFGVPLSPAEKLQAVFPQSQILKSAATEPDSETAAWAGICNGVAEAAVDIDIPSETVVYKNVEFKPYELKAIAGQLLANGNGSYVFLGARNNGAAIPVDPSGRPIFPVVRDTNPGAFHIFLASQIGITKRPMFIDTQIDDVVLAWPVFEYSAVGPATLTASETILAKKHNPYAASYVKFTTTLKMSDSHQTVVSAPNTFNTKEKQYSYILELNNENKIIGGEWLDPLDHPDFIYGRNVDFNWKTVAGASDLEAILSSTERKPFDPTPLLNHPDNKVPLPY